MVAYNLSVRKSGGVELRLLPREINAAHRNAVDQTARYTRDRLVREAKDRTGIKLGINKLKQRIIIRRTTQTDSSADLKISGTRFRLSDFRYTRKRISRTRAAVNVEDRLDGGARLSPSAFVNPKHNTKRIMRRARKKTGLEPRLAVTAKGPAMGELAQQITDGAFNTAINDFYNRALDKQVSTKLSRRNG